MPWFMAATYTIFFFFPAEDGIRYRNVTGVQTCALPIYPQRLEEEGPYAAVGHEADGVPGADRGAAHPAADLGRELECGISALVPRHHLDELHERRRVEEVHADDS